MDGRETVRFFREKSQLFPKNLVGKTMAGSAFLSLRAIGFPFRLPFPSLFLSLFVEFD